MKKYTKKQILKLVANVCYFCGENDYNLLDAHRILEGHLGGTYHERNTVVVCATCHRKIHSGRIIIHGKYLTTGKKQWILHYFIDGEEKWG